MLNSYAKELGAPPRSLNMAPMKAGGSWVDIHFWPLLPETIGQSEWRWLILLLLLIIVLLLCSLTLCLARWAKGHRFDGYHAAGKSVKKDESASHVSLI
jgi:type VI protein secretion system component VasK